MFGSRELSSTLDILTLMSSKKMGQTLGGFRGSFSWNYRIVSRSLLNINFIF